MKVTVELSGAELKDICRITGERKKGPAIRRLVIDALNLQRRREIDEKFLSGEWGVELRGFEEARAADRARARELTARWRR